MASVSYEKRPLKRPRLGPPDVYPQEPKQKEDELTAHNVKQGFSSSLQITDEYGTARSSNITAAKIGTYFTAIIAKKHELNTFQDNGRKKQQINPKDNFWPVTARSKNAIEAWFKDLAGSKPLTSLAKKVPIFNKKEEIFMTLYEYSVPMLRAAWFIKMTSAYTIAISEAKIKKRQLSDPSQEWTQTLTRFLREQLQKMADHYNVTSPTVTNSLSTGSGATADLELSLKQWHYCTELARYLYEEGLLDRQDFLTWVLELLEKTKTIDDSVLKLLLPLALQYVDEFVHCELLSRRLASFCARKLNQMCSEVVTGSSRTQSPLTIPNGNGNAVNMSNNLSSVNPVVAAFMEYNNCPHHRNIMLELSAMLQVITLDCPSALVWNDIAEGKATAALNGSPLDFLPCAPSSLPMPPRSNNGHIRARLKACEQQIRQRGRAAEVRWCSDKWQQSTASATISRVLYVLDILDRHAFDRVDSNNSMDTLYSKIFPSSGVKDHSEPVGNDDCIVQLLCEWAVCTQRSGEHRALVVAKMLEKRQNELTSEKYADSDGTDEKDSISSTSMVSSGIPVFQNLLMKFLDTEAPIFDDSSSQETKCAFSNLVLLFSELIRHDIFSHDAYMCTLISRGTLVMHPSGTGAAIALGMVNASLAKPTTPELGLLDTKPESIKQDLLVDTRSLFDPLDAKPSVIKQEDNLDFKMDLDDAKIDDDLDKILQHIKQEQQNNIEQPDSVGSDKGEPTPLTSVTPLASTTPITADIQPIFGNCPSRHLIFVTHFPLPQDDSSSHDCNQRHVLLYGVGKGRDEARHVVKKMIKEIMKLFSKKCSMDATEGGKVKKHPSKGEFNFETTMTKFQNLSCFDQHVVTMSCMSSVIEMYSSFASGSSNYLPLVEHVSFLLDIMEVALNIHGLLEFCIQLLKELIEVESHLVFKSSNLIGSYTTSVCLYVVGILRRYHCCLLVSQEQTATAFEGLCKIVKHVTNPTDCSSAERCILSHLYDVYTLCSFLKSKHFEPFSNAYPKVKQTLYTSIHPSALNLLWNTSFMTEHINNPREYISIPKLKLDSQLVKQLNEIPANRYSFVCNAVVSICNTQDADRLNEISILCSELTACCSALSSEWLGVLSALCCSSNHSCGFIDVLTQVDVVDLSIHDSLALFTSILIARHCFSLHDFVVEVAMPSLLAACPTEGGNTDPDAESGARLTCHLLLQIFKTVETPQPSSYSSGMSPVSVSSQKPSYALKYSCDRHLLAAAHHSISAGAVVAVLKAILFLGDAAVGESKSKSEVTKTNSGELSISNILGTVDEPELDYGLGVPIMAKPSGGGIESASLSEFAKHALKQICSQEWVHERCLKDPEQLCNQGFLVDHMLSNKQAQQLLHLICYPYSSQQISEEHFDQKQMITRILQNLDQWTLRVSSLELQLMYKHCSQNASELSQWLDNVARITIDIFQLQTDENSKSISTKPEMKSGLNITLPKGCLGKPSSIWLVAPLVSKLHPSVQGRVLRAAGQVLESGNWSSKSKDKDRNVQRSTSLLSHQPFLSLVLTCLKGQDEQREGLLTSLHSQLSQFLHLSKDDKFHTEEPKVKQAMQDALQLRLSLVGGMFDTIQRSVSITMDWSVLLVQLISFGVVDTQTNSELFTTVLDMLAMLIHNTLVSESSTSDKCEETKKQYQNLIKKLKKELADKNSDAIDQVRQLLPLSKQQCEVIACEPMGSLIDTKGNKIAGFDSIDKKQGLQVSEKQKVSSWDMLEGHKNPAPLSWSWFGAIRMERKPLKYEDVHRLLQYHTHSMKKNPSYFLEPPPLPPEDLYEPPQEKLVPWTLKEEKDRETPTSDQSPRSNAVKKPKQTRRRRNPRTAANQQPMMPAVRPTGGVRPMGFQEQPMYPQTPHQNWYSQQQQQSYYSQQQLPPGGPRFEQRNHISQSKAALTNMLRARHPNSQYMTGATQASAAPPAQQPTGFQGLDMLHKQRMLRHQLRPQQAMQPGPSGLFPQHLQGNVGQTGTLHHVSQQGMAPAYSNFSNNIQQPAPLMDTPANMIPASYSPNFANQGNMGMMPAMRPSQQTSFMTQQMQQRAMSQSSRAQYPMAQSAMQAPNVTVNPQMGYSRTIQGMGGPPPPSHMQQLRQQQQQQLLAMQQIPSSQQSLTQQQQTAQLVAHLQQTLSSGGHQATQQHPFHQQHQF